MFRIGRIEHFERHPHAADGHSSIVRRATDQLGGGVFEFTRTLDQNRPVGVIVKRRFIARHLGADFVTERHLGQSLGHAAEPDGPTGDDTSVGDAIADEIKVAFQLLRIGHPR